MLGLKLNHVNKRGYWCKVIISVVWIVAIVHKSPMMKPARDMGIPSARLHLVSRLVSASATLEFICLSTGLSYRNRLIFLYVVDTLIPRQDCRHFADNIFKCIFLYEDIWIVINISRKFVPRDQINNIPALVPTIEPIIWTNYLRIYASRGLNELILISRTGTGEHYGN